MAHNNFILNLLPKVLQNKVKTVQQVLQKPSVVKVAVSLCDTFTLKETDTALLPQYDFQFPVLHCLAEVTNHLNGIEASVCREFSDIGFRFLSSKNISIANILDFLSDISKESIGFPDIAAVKISVESEMPAEDSVYFIIHDYTGLLTTLNNVLKYFKSKHVSCLQHYSDKVCLGNMSLVCTDVSLDVFSSSKYLAQLGE